MMSSVAVAVAMHKGLVVRESIVKPCKVLTKEPVEGML